LTTGLPFGWVARVSISAAYAPFVAALLGGRFAEPEPGEWTAEQIAAHVTLNNDLIAEMAERIAAGETVAYDNEPAVADEDLARYAAEVGGLAGLARAVERSAARLEQAKAALGERAGTELPVVIRDGGEIVRDGPIPVGAFIDGNAGFHLAAHLDQLKALNLETRAAPPDEFDQYQLIILERAPDQPELDEATLTDLNRRHLGHFATMRAAGLLMIAGPIAGDEAVAGICMYRAGSVERARALAEDDPAVREGRFTVRAMTWYTSKDGIVWPR
jgi:uncharacterized protein YciI